MTGGRPPEYVRSELLFEYSLRSMRVLCLQLVLSTPSTCPRHLVRGKRSPLTLGPGRHPLRPPSPHPWSRRTGRAPVLLPPFPNPRYSSGDTTPPPFSFEGRQRVRTSVSHCPHCGTGTPFSPRPSPETLRPLQSLLVLEVGASRLQSEVCGALLAYV